MSVPAAVQHAVRERAEGRYEYCHSPEWVCAARFTLDHLLPRSRGGTHEPHNLALACRRCNERRYNFTTGRDPVTQKEIPLFHPVQHVWSEHFAWTPDGQWIVGTTAIGRATVERLDLNDERHDDGFIRVSRILWVRGCWHPPPKEAVDGVVTHTHIPRRRRPVQDYLQGQGRYRHLFAPHRNDSAIQQIQEQVDRYWAAV